MRAPRSFRSLLVLALACVSLLGLGACAHRAPPADAVRAYLRALDRNDPDAAYALLSEETRREVSREQFAAHWRENHDAARADAAALHEGLSHGVAQDARIVYGDGFAVPATRDAVPAPGGWRLSEVPSAHVPHAATPEEALAAFQRQLAAHDWEAMSRVVSPGTREAVERELRERTSALADHPGLEVTGDKARLKLGRFELVLEKTASGEWRVVGVK
jgi:hypothetical protein